jgi:hypothetical protein
LTNGGAPVKERKREKAKEMNGGGATIDTLRRLKLSLRVCLNFSHTSCRMNEREKKTSFFFPSIFLASFVVRSIYIFPKLLRLQFLLVCWTFCHSLLPSLLFLYFSPSKDKYVMSKCFSFTFRPLCAPHLRPDMFFDVRHR